MGVEPVTSADDARLSDYRSLTDAEMRRRYEQGRGVFVVEGETVLRQVVARGLPLRSVLLSERQHVRLADLIETLDVPVFVGSQHLLNGVTGFNIHRGVVAIAERPPERQVADVANGARRLLVVEAVNDLENLGVLFRSAAGLGIDAVVLDPRCADPLYRRVVRVSMGHVLTVPFARARTWPGALDDLRAARFTVAALTPRGSVTVHEAGLSDVDRLALLVGAEGPGLTAEAMQRAEVRVAIPMARDVDSLNVATAAAIAMFAARPAAATRR